jgi:hypothetical protein
MIMASFGCYLPQTGHDHESTRGGRAGGPGIWLVIFGLMEVTLTWRLRSAGG